VKAVDELEAQGDQQRHAQQQERRPGGDHRAQFVHVVHQAVGGEQQAHGQHGKNTTMVNRPGFLSNCGLRYDGAAEKVGVAIADILRRRCISDDRCNCYRETALDQV
jgi:hypothetical protein